MGKQLLTAENILSGNGVRPTVNRVAILDVFITENKSFPHARLMKILGDNINRVSLYRVLSDLVEAGILCRLINSTGAAQYHYLQHASDKFTLSPHFKCNTCEQIVALPRLPATYLTQILDLGTIEHSSLLIEGVCQKCTQKRY